MSLPTISPTGAMSSDDYLTYMIAYLDGSLTILKSDIDSYLVDQTATDWYNKWDTILDDLTLKITTLNTDINTVKAQITMLNNAIDAL